MVQQLLRKIRGFVVDLHTGKPIPNVVLLFEAKIIDDKSEFTFPLGMLVTDSAGYTSLDLSHYIEDKLPQTIQITPVGDENCQSSVNASFVNRAELKIHFVLKVNSNCVKCKANVGLPSIQNPDDIDREVSPHSFAVKNELMLGEGNCQVPIPTPFEQRDFRFGRVVLRADPNLDGDLPTVSQLDPTIDLGQRESAPLPLRIGEVLEFRQRWYPVGHSLGQIAYSLPLAPCESVNLAMIDWSRQDTILRKDSVQARESLIHEQRRDRTIEETIEAALSEEQNGFSILGGAAHGNSSGASAVIPVEGIPINLSTALSNMLSAGGGIAHTSGNRDITGDSHQELHDRVRQATSVVRFLNSTVIVQATQREQNVVQTRTVTNHNHCHALTVQYYEVLQTFRVVTEFERRRRVLLIPYKIVSFDWNIALRFETLLRVVLLEPSLAACFDAIKRLHLCPQIYPDSEGTAPATEEGGTTPEKPKKPTPKTVKYELTLTTGKAKVLDLGLLGKRTFGSSWGPVYVKFLLKNGDLKQLYHKPRYGEGAEIIKSEPGAFQFEFEKDWRIDISFPNECIGLNPFDIQEVNVRWMEANADDAWGFQKIKIRYQLEGEDQLNYTLLEASDPNYLAWFDIDVDLLGNKTYEKTEWKQPVSAPPVISPKEEPVILEEPSTPTGTGQPPVRLSQKADECCEQRLLTHLNGNIGYYNRAIWLLQDPVERRVLLDGLLAATNLADLVDETPVAVSGRYVAFPFDDPRLENVLLQSAVREALSRLGLSQDLMNEIWNRAVETGPQEPEKPEPLVSYVNLPTRGLFAEAQLGHCNSCEVRDVTRFWKWDESPCEKAPSIEGISPGPKGQAPTIPEPTALPNPVVQVMQAPAAPDPVGLAAALNLLGQPNIFRDMSGIKEVSDLLEKLASGAVSSRKDAQNLAKQAQSALNKAALSGGGASGNGVGRPGSTFEPDAINQIDRLNAIDYSKQKGLTNDADSRQLARGLLGGDIILASSTGGAALVQKGVELVNDVTSDALKNIIPKFINSPKLKMDKIADGAALLSGYSNLNDYKTSPPPLNMKRQINVRFDNLGGGPFFDGFTGLLKISWVDYNYLNYNAMTAADKRRWQAMQTIMCKTDVQVIPSGIVGGSWSEVEVNLDLIVDKTVDEWDAEINYYGNLEIRIGAVLLVDLILTPTVGPGGTKAQTIPIPLDPIRETPMWYIVQDNDEATGEPFIVLKFGGGQAPFPI